MARLRARDRAVLALLVPLWIACFALSLYERASGRPSRPTLLVTAGSAGGYPVVARYRPGFAAPPDAPRPGDLLVRLADFDLRGVGPVRVLALSLASAREDGRFAVEYERAGVRASAEIALLREDWPWRTTLVAVGFAITAVILIARAPSSRQAQAFLPSALVWSLTQIQFQGPEPAQTYAYLAVRSVAGCLWAPLGIHAALQFPEEAAPRGRAPRWPWLFSVLGLTWTSMWFGIPFPLEVGTRANPAVGAAVIATELFVVTRNYRRAGPAGRRQVKWVLLGIYLGLLPVLAAVAAAAVDPELVWLWNVSLSALVAIPLSIFIAITRSNLLDIDRVISATATYSLLVTLAVAGGLTALPRLAGLVSERSGLDAAAVQVALGVLVAPLVVGVGRGLRPRLERVFFAERHALQHGVDALARRLAAAPDAETLLVAASESLDALLRPTCCVIYGRAGEVYAPVVARGASLAPTFPKASPLLRALAERGSPVDLERGRRALLSLGASAEDRGAIGGMGAVALLPIVSGADLLGLVALGRKRSGDVYTAADLALLGVVAAAIQAGLSRLGEKELLQEARALQERLRRYVPASLASELARGRALESGEREVTVLFADLRSYTSLSQGRLPEEIFAAVSRYAALVSECVVRHAGTVVEYAGDGLMAVFGAPEPLPGKERAAVTAALEIARVLADLELFPGGERGGATAVGIGVATGEAYVGTIQSVDHNFWSAIGHTTNLAARLQSLTRDLDAWVAVDEATWRGAGEAARAFERRPRVAIRGLAEPCDVFVLRAPSAR